MELNDFCERYLIDIHAPRTWEEKNARSMALATERLLQGRQNQATRLFAYNHALNQNRPAPVTITPKPSKPAVKVPSLAKWKVRVWKNNKVVKTLTVDSDVDKNVIAKINSLGIPWDKATLYDPNTTKQLKKIVNV